MTATSGEIDPSLALEGATRDLLDQLDQRPPLARLALGLVDPSDYAGILATLYEGEGRVEITVRRALPKADPLMERMNGTDRLARDLAALDRSVPTFDDALSDRFRPDADFALGALWGLWFRHRRDPGLTRRLAGHWADVPAAYLTVEESDIDRFWHLQHRLVGADPAETAAGGRYALAEILEAVGG